MYRILYDVIMSDNYSFKQQNHSFVQNISLYFHIENVNRNLLVFVDFCIFIIINQNICFLSFYVNQVFHMLFMWIMWITLCIT